MAASHRSYTKLQARAKTTLSYGNRKDEGRRTEADGSPGRMEYRVDEGGRREPDGKRNGTWSSAKAGRSP